MNSSSVGPTGLGCQARRVGLVACALYAYDHAGDIGEYYAMQDWAGLHESVKRPYIEAALLATASLLPARREEAIEVATVAMGLSVKLSASRGTLDEAIALATRHAITAYSLTLMDRRLVTAPQEVMA